MKNNTILFLLCGIISTSIGIAFGAAKERSRTQWVVERAYLEGYKGGMFCEKGELSLGDTSASEWNKLGGE